MMSGRGVASLVNKGARDRGVVALFSVVVDDDVGAWGGMSRAPKLARLVNPVQDLEFVDGRFRDGRRCCWAG